MKSERRSVLQTDGLLVAIMLGTGLVSDGVSAVRSLPLVAVTIGVLIPLSVALAEHDVVPGVFPEVATIGAFLITVGVGIAFVQVLPVESGVVAAAALIGGGIGLAGYRIVFGLIRPIPAYRLSNGPDTDEDGPDI